MRIAAIVAAVAGLAAAQINYNETTGQYTCAQPNQAYCAGDSLKINIILRCDKDAVGHPGNCNDNLAGEPPTGNTYSPCWQTSNTTGDAACSKNCVVYGGSGNYNGTFTLPAEDCTPTYTATSSTATTATTLTQSVTSSSASSDSDPTTGAASETETTIAETATTTVCTETESSTASTGAVTGSSPPSVTTSATSATTIMPPPASSNGPSGGGSPPLGGSSASKPTGPGPVVTSTSTSTSSVAGVSTTSFPTAGAASNHVGVGLGVVGLLVGAML